MKFPISFIKDDKLVLNVDSVNFKTICPRVVKFNEGFYRMYFSQQKKLVDRYSYYTTIRSAVSKDCINWSLEGGDRLGNLSDERFCRMLSPSVIKIDSSLYRMYFEARTFDNEGVIKSALSNDGVLWKEEQGIRIGKLNNFSYGTPFCFMEIKNQFELYFEKRSKLTRDIWVATSSDGIFFDERNILPVLKQEKIWESYAVYSPDLIYSNNLYHLFYSGWGGDPLMGHILYAYSYDKKNWKKYETPIISPGAKYDYSHCSEPSLIKIDDKWKIFYEGCDSNKLWRILCAQQS